MANSDVQDLLITGLRNAHALEGQAIEILTRQAQRLEHYPELEARIRQHIEESRQQQAMVEECLTRLDATPSTLKEAALRLTADMAALAHSVMGDEVLKNSFASYAFEHFEIASYQALTVMAERAGDMQTARVAQTIILQEQEMAQWLAQHLPQVVNRFIDLSGTGNAKR